MCVGNGVDGVLWAAVKTNFSREIIGNQFGWPRLFLSASKDPYRLRRVNTSGPSDSDYQYEYNQLIFILHCVTVSLTGGEHAGPIIVMPWPSLPASPATLPQS